jgi:hemolysin III
MHGIQQRVFGVVWTGAAASILVKTCWAQAPKWLSAAFGIALGWFGLAAMPQLAHTPGRVALLAADGSPSLAARSSTCGESQTRPRIFCNHELFHTLTLVARSCGYVAVAIFVRVG